MKITIIKRKDDPAAVRISIGAAKGAGAYLVYRGSLIEVKALLAVISDAIQQLDGELDVSAEEGEKEEKPKIILP